MLHYEDAQGLILITQPAHAWVSGQMARAWGNARFGAFGPREEVCLAAEQHDLGWSEWEAAPTFNAETGRPHDFLQVDRATHAAIWTAAGPRMLTQSRYAALLVSMHGSGLYEDFGLDGPSEKIEATRRFLEKERAFQESVRAKIDEDWRHREALKPDALERNRRLIRAWDAMSLALYVGPRREKTIERVPTVKGEATTLTMRPLAGDPEKVVIDPWPFEGRWATVDCEGRRWERDCADEREMREALARATWVSLRTRLIPKG